jgi:phosphoribosyl-dephospho-CoA transferase
MWDAQTNRKPTLLFRLFGWLLFRLAQRALSRLLFQQPPRKARVCSQGAPPAEASSTLFTTKIQKAH